MSCSGTYGRGVVVELFVGLKFIEAVGLKV